MLKDHPIFGAGLGGYPIVFRPYHHATAIEIFQYPHNIVLNFWSEMGLGGVVVFIWMVILWIRAAKKDPTSKSYKLTTNSFVMIAPLIAILIHGLVDVPYFKNDLAILFWLLIFLTVFSFGDKKRESR